MNKHRKLFPALAETNQSVVDCSYFCDQTCPYNCYPDTDYYNPPPPQPREHGISPFLIVLVSVLASFFLLVSYYIMTSKSCSTWLSNNNNRRRRRRNEDRGEADDDTEYEDEEENNNRIDHPIWLITTAGLQQTIINSITVCKYKKGEGLIEGTECSVCLSEFQQDETLRLLPKCNHAFHMPCIDTWLRSHTNCPLCRAYILVNDPPLASAVRNAENLSAVSDTRVSENREIDSGEPCRNRDGVGRDVSLEIISEIQITRRRSLSMDSSTINKTIDQIDLKKEGGKMGSSSITRHLHKTPVAMKRSFSCGGRFFSSRQNRNLNAFLPL